MMPRTELIKALDQSLIDRIDNLTKWVKQLSDELYVTRHFVYCHCSHSGAYADDVCSKCELLKYCWPPADYGKNFLPVQGDECIGCEFEQRSFDEQPCVEYLGTTRTKCPFRQARAKT